MKKLQDILSFILGRNWVIPVLAILVSLISTGLCLLLGGQSMSASVAERHRLGLILDWVLMPQVLMILGLPLWLLVLTIVRLVKKQLWVGWAWLWSLLAGIAMMVCATISAFISAYGDYDDFTLGISVPEEMTPGSESGLAVPVDMHFQPPLNEGENATLPPIVQQYADRCERDHGIVVGDDEELTGEAPHVEKLAAEAPELLLEYKLRAFCHQALTPGSTAAPHLEMLQHPHAAELHKIRDAWYLHEEVTPWKKDCQNNWEINITLSRENQVSGLSPFSMKKLKMLDTALAPLAANPTHEGLDALLPPLPDKPTIVLAQRGQPGMYKLLLVVPHDYPRGSFRISAREYTQGKELSTRVLDTMHLTPRPCGEICQLACSDTFTVYSGEWGEYYASVWELHFTPESGGESRCVNSQLYLMQGWSR